MKTLFLVSVVACVSAQVVLATPAYTKEVADAREDFAEIYEKVEDDGPEEFFVDYTKEVADARADFAKTYEKVSDDGPAHFFVDYTKEVANARDDFAKTYSVVARRHKRNVFLPALFTDMEKGADDDKITAYSRNDPSWAYGFTTKSQYTLKPVTYSGYPFYPFAPAVVQAAPSRARREAAVSLPVMQPMMPSFPATWHSASLPVTYRTGAIPYFTQPFNNFLPFKTQ